MGQEEIPMISELEQTLLAALYHSVESNSKYVRIFKPGIVIKPVLLGVNVEDEGKEILARVGMSVPPFEAYEFIILWDRSNFLTIKFDGKARLSRDGELLTRRRLLVRESYSFLTALDLGELWPLVASILPRGQC